MLIGVISFSFISGSVSSIVQSYDDQVSLERERTQKINKISKQFQLNNSIQLDLKRELNFDRQK